MDGFISIRYKFLAVMTFLLLFCVGLYLFVATSIFVEDKTELVFDYNKNVVTNLSADLNDLFQRVGDRMKLTAHFYHQNQSNAKQLISEIIEKSEELAFVGGSHRFEKINQTFHVDADYLETYGLQKSQFLEGAVLESVPFQQIKNQGEAIWSVSVADGVAPLIGYGKSVLETDAQGQVVSQFAVLAFIKPDSLYQEMSSHKLNEVIVTNTDGELLVAGTSSKKEVAQEMRLLFERAKKFPLATHVLQYEKNGERFLGAFSKGSRNRFVALSNVPYAKAFAAIDRLIYRSAILGSLLFTLAVLGAIFLSRSITRPMDNLVKGMDRVRSGDLEVRIPIQTNDEVAVLATNFNSMIRDLETSRSELTAMNRNLEDKVRERTNELEVQNQAVKEAQEVLLKTTRLASIGEVAGQAAHEVLNPLTSIISRLQRMKKDLKGEAGAQQFLSDLYQSWSQDLKSGGAAQLFETWSSPSKVEPGKSLLEEDLTNFEKVLGVTHRHQSAWSQDMQFLLDESHRINRIVSSMRSMSVSHSEKRECDVHTLVERSVNLMKDMADKQGVEVCLDLKAHWHHCKIDEDELIQSLTNILRNSLQAIEEAERPEGRINVSSQNRQEELVVVVEDNGVGVLTENRDRIFKMQFTTKSKDRGTGLGLSITRRFLRGFGGDIDLVWSEPGQGSRFEIRLPYLTPQEGEKTA